MKFMFRINLKKIFKTLSLFFLTGFILPKPILAVCPVCTVAVCAGVGFSRWLKIDDLISGIWVGGLIISMIAWTINFLNNKKIKFKFRKILITIFYYALTIIPLYQLKVVGHPQNKFKYLNIDKLILGIISGSIFFILSILFNDWLKKKNNGKVYFPFQKVVIPLLFLGINSLIFYYLSKC